MTCGSGPCNVVCSGDHSCVQLAPVKPTSIYCGDAPCNIECSGQSSCTFLRVYGGNGPVTISCSDFLACNTSSFFPGKGSFELVCTGSQESCTFATIRGGPGPMSIECSGGALGNCFLMNIYGGRGSLNLTCDNPVSSNDPCQGMNVIQNSSTITEFKSLGPYLSFSCAPGLWQCPPAAYLSSACVSTPAGCWSSDQDALTAFYNGLTDTTTLNWVTTSDLCLNGATGVTCVGGRVTAL